MNLNSISKLWEKLKNKKYREGYVEGQIEIEFPFQIRALRQARNWTHKQLAGYSGISKKRIVELEDTHHDPITWEELYKLSAAFDVALMLKFASFSELVRHESEFHPETFDVTDFSNDSMPTDRETQINDYVAATSFGNNWFELQEITPSMLSQASATNNIIPLPLDSAGEEFVSTGNNTEEVSYGN